MSKDLALSKKKGRGGGALARPGAQGGSAPAPDPGRGVSVNEVTFTAKGYTYDNDIPTEFRKGAAASTALALRAKEKKAAAGTLAVYDKKVAEANVISPRSAAEQAKIEAQVIASGARQLEKPRRSMGRIVQRRVGWQATPTLIVITTAERELTRGEDGKMRPSGEWLIEHRKTYRNLDGAAEKRVGNVVADDAEPESPTVHAASPGGQQQGSPTPAVPAPATAQDSFPEGTFALSFLPRAVRSSVIARVPSPTVFDGTSLQFSHPQTGEVDRLEVNVIRMDDSRAVVVQARRKPGGREWEVSQATYSLGEPEIEQV